MVMPLTYSIAYGLIAGIASYLVMEGAFRILSFVGLEVPDETGVSKPVLGKSVEETKDGKAICDAMPEPENKVVNVDGDEPEAGVDEVNTEDQAELCA